MIDVTNQARAYAQWAKDNDVESIAVWPLKKSGHTVESRHALLTALFIEDTPIKNGHWLPVGVFNKYGKERKNDIAHKSYRLLQMGYDFPEVDPADYK